MHTIEGTLGTNLSGGEKYFLSKPGWVGLVSGREKRHGLG